MNNFDINLISNNGRTLVAHVSYLFPDHFIVEIHHLQLTLKVSRTQSGGLECEDHEDLHSHLVDDICEQINYHLNKFERS